MASSVQDVQALSEYSYDAEIANCSYNLDIGDNGIILTFPGSEQIQFLAKGIWLPRQVGRSHPGWVTGA